ncbi:MAG: thioredoxin [Lachnospiraceae bacterium]|nr:thioredoxin [Lachnospiraceae bacterium]
MVYKFDESNFDAEVLQSDIPVFVDFYADWCGPCKMMSPVIDKLAEEYDGKIKVGKVNVDENGDLAVKYGIMSIPNMVFFKNGEVADRVVGAIPKPAMKEKFEKNA